MKTIYKTINRGLFKLRVKKNGRNMFFNIYNGQILTVHEMIYRSLFKKAFAKNEHDYKYGDWWFFQILETIPDYFEDDFFTDDDSDNIFWYVETARDHYDSAEGGGASIELLSMIKEYGIFKTIQEESDFISRMKEWFPWQYGKHNWIPFETNNRI